MERQVNSKFINAERKGDIWSLASVFSEAASWVTYGVEAIEEYREKRTTAIAQVLGFQDSDCFHTGNSVLPEVEAWHTKLAKICRASDRVTPKIWKRLLEDCFKEHELRFNAAQFLARTYELMQVQKGVPLLKTHAGPDISRGRDQGPPPPPPPPKRAQTLDTSISNTNRSHQPHNSIVSNSSDMSYLQPTRNSGATFDTSTTPTTPPSGSLGPKASTGSHHTQDNSAFPGYGKSRATEVPSSPPFYNQTYLGLATNVQEEGMHLDSTPSAHQTQRVDDTEPAHDVTVRLSHLDIKGKAKDERAPKQPCPIHDTHEYPLPSISVAEVEHWKDRRKSRLLSKESEKLANEDLLNRVKDRNHVCIFLS